MKRVLITELLPGMVLARPVTNASGLPVIPAGGELNGPIIDRLIQLSLTYVYIEGDAGDSTGKTLAELQAEIEHRFRSVIHDPLQQRIVRRLKDHLEATRGVQNEEEITGA